MPVFQVCESSAGIIREDNSDRAMSIVCRPSPPFRAFGDFQPSPRRGKSAPRLIVVDEIGKMECISGLFRKLVKESLDSPVPFLGTIALRGTPPIERIKGRPDVKLISMSLENREGKFREVLEEVRGVIL